MLRIIESVLVESHQQQWCYHQYYYYQQRWFYHQYYYYQQHWWYCSVRLTGTSSCTTSTVSWGLLPACSPWIPARKRTKRRPSGRVHSDALVSQQETPKNCPPTYLSTAYGTLKVVKEIVYMCVCCLLQAKIFFSHLYVTLKHGQATKEFLVNLPKVPTLFPTFPALFKLSPAFKAP